MESRPGTDSGDDPLAADGRRPFAAPRSPGEPEQRAMAQSLPDWDLEPPAMIIRRVGADD
jgi:hypothetical protein